MAPERNPACTGHALNQLYLIKDAMYRHEFNEATLRCADVLVRIENEIEWCYGTDLVLPFMKAFFMELSELNSRLMHCTHKDLKMQVAEAIKTLERTASALCLQKQDTQLEKTPETPDALERDVRVRQVEQIG
jgi:hypothetical protein